MMAQNNSDGNDPTGEPTGTPAPATDDGAQEPGRNGHPVDTPTPIGEPADPADDRANKPDWPPTEDTLNEQARAAAIAAGELHADTEPAAPPTQEPVAEPQGAPTEPPTQPAGAPAPTQPSDAPENTTASVETTPVESAPPAAETAAEKEDLLRRARDAVLQHTPHHQRVTLDWIREQSDPVLRPHIPRAAAQLTEKKLLDNTGRGVRRTEGAAEDAEDARGSRLAPSAPTDPEGTAAASDDPVVRFLDDLDNLGVPIFIARPGVGQEFTRPKAWQTLTADGNQQRFTEYQARAADPDNEDRPWYSPCALTGHAIAVLDVDPRNGGDIDKVRALLAGLDVRIFAEVDTPGGGKHYYVAGHPDLPTVHSHGDTPELSGYPGLDLQSHGANVFAPGTHRPKYHGKGYTVVFDDLAALGDGGDPDGAEALADWVATHRTSTGGECTASPPWDGRAPDTRQAAYLDAVLSGQTKEVAETTTGGRNQRLFLAALKCGSYVAGAGLDEQSVIEHLERAAAACGLTRDDGPASVAATIASGLRSGRKNPRAVPGPADRETTDHTGVGARPAKTLFDGPPVPLTRTPPPPLFPVESLPTLIADMVRSVAEATQTDPAMPGTSALSALSACTGGHAEIEIRRGWREPLCLYTATIAGPGERKSAVQMSMVRPILDIEHQLAETGALTRLEAETLKAIALKDAERAKNIASSAEHSDKTRARAEAVSALVAAEAITIPPIPRLVADDITPEAAASLLAEQGGRLAIISAEGGIFDIIAGRYNGNVPNMDLWLKGHSGDPLKVDRKGRPPEYVRRPALTLGLMIQPSVLSAIAANQAFRGRGFLARILYACPVSKVGTRTIAPPPVEPAVEAAYDATVRDLAAGLVGWSGDPAILTLTEAAEKAVQALETAVEPTLAGDGELATLADWGAKYVGAVMRIAGIIHLAEHGADPGVRTPVTDETITAAATLGEYFKSAAIIAFSEMQTDEVTADALYLLGRLEKLSTGEVSERDLHQASRRRFPRKTTMMSALRRLIEHGYLAPVPTEESTGGRPASPRYRVNDMHSEAS